MVTSTIGIHLDLKKTNETPLWKSANEWEEVSSFN